MKLRSARPDFVVDRSGPYSSRDCMPKPGVSWRLLVLIAAYALFAAAVVWAAW